MGKREASLFAAQLDGVDVDAPRAKRYKTAATPANQTGTVKDEQGPTNGLEHANGGVKDDPEAVKEKGLKLWQAIKDAVNKEGRILSIDFLRLPSKRQYPDYYQLIKRPIALDDIKRQLDGGGYATFDEVKQDFEQCFKNAKRYNMKESQIWKDAKHLHKLVTKESNKLTGIEGTPDGGEDHDGHGEGSEAEGESGKKKKTPNMTRLLKTRLQKLVDKTDDTGRVLSAEFMELPSKKVWPMYYKQIKRPQCFENIFKHLKRKEYTSALDFANDVELVFSNALEFNQEHTPIWEDTIVLRDYFRQLMSDLPSPFTIAAYASPDHSTKIKLKMPTATHPASVVQPAVRALVSTPQPDGIAPNASPRLRIPPLASTSTTPAVPQPHTPTIAPAAGHAVTAASAAPPVTAQTPTFNQQAYAYAQQKQMYPTSAYQASAVASTSTPTLPNTNNIHVNVPRVAPKPHHVPHLPAVPVAVVPRTPQPPPVKVPNQIPPSLLAAKSPTPVAMHARRQLRSVSVVTKPFGRRLDLDYREGVRVWSARLGSGETSVHIADVQFLSHRGDGTDSSDEETHKNKEKDQEAAKASEKAAEPPHREEEEEEPEEEPKPKRGRGRPRKIRGGKPGEASPRAKDKGKAKAEAPQVPPEEDEVQVMLNGASATRVEEGKDAWEVPLAVGLNVIEVGEKGSVMWRMYLERMMSA